MKRVITINVDGTEVKLRRRPDNGLRAYSDELPGLILSGKDWWKVMLDLSPAITVLKSFDCTPPKLVSSR